MFIKWLKICLFYGCIKYEHKRNKLGFSFLSFLCVGNVYDVQDVAYLFTKCVYKIYNVVNFLFMSKF